MTEPITEKEIDSWIQEDILTEEEANEIKEDLQFKISLMKEAQEDEKNG